MTQNEPKSNRRPKLSRVTRKTSPTLSSTGAAVKGRIVTAGVKLSDLAAAAGIRPNTLSNYLSGRLRRGAVQFEIWKAFRRLTGSRITLLEFWGVPHGKKEVA